jgi:hypothetical protein
MITSLKLRAGAVCALMPLGVVAAPGWTAGVSAAPGSFRPGGNTFVAMYTEPGELIDGSTHILYRQPAPADQNPNNVISSFSNETDSTRLEVSFPDDGAIHLAAPTGKTLTLGRHRLLAGAGPSGWAMDAGFLDGSCDDPNGHVDIRDLRVDPSTGLQRLSMTFTLYCGGVTSALGGEVEFGEPQSHGLQAAPAHVDLPRRALGTTSPAVPVVFVNTSATPQTVTGTRLSGSSQITKGRDGCRGVSMRAGGSCEIGIRFAPSSTSTQSASLTVTTGNGAQAATALRGKGVATITGLFVTDTLPNGLVAPLANLRWDRGGSFQNSFGAHGAFVRAVSLTDLGDAWQGDVAPPTGRSLAAGETFPAAREADATHAENTISGTEQPACVVVSSSIHIIQWNVGADSESPRHIEFTFTDVCGHGVGTIRGVVADDASAGPRRPAPRLALPHRPFSVSDLLEPRWSGPSSDRSGYQVRIATATAGSSLGAWRLSPETAKGRAHIPTIRGTTTCVSVRAITLLQTPSVWSHRQCSGTLVNASLLLPSPAGGPNQGWAAAHNSHAIGHVLARATRHGSTLALKRVAGDRFAVRAMVGRRFGAIDVYVDNYLLRHIDLARHRHHRSRLVTFLSSRRKPFSGELRVVVASHHRPVDIDAVGVRPA